MDDLGGKAANLDALIRYGFDVPAGFCITTRAFRESLEAWCGSRMDEESLESLILHRDMPPLIEAEILSASVELIRMVGPGLAARSSATDEDLSNRSMAGQNATVLNITSPAGVLEGVRRCWASLFSSESVIYRSGGTDSLGMPEMGVVVQQMIPAEAAGVMFTADPVTGSRLELLISASSGLGEAVVAGRSSDTWHLDRDGRVLRREISEKGIAVEARPGGGVGERAVPESQRCEPVLDDNQLSRLVQVGLRAEARFGQAQDLEWAFWKNRIYVLQARPITRTGKEGQPRAVLSNVNVGEALPGVGTPYTWSIIRAFSTLGLEHAFGAMGCSVPQGYQMVLEIRGRVYLNVSEFMSVASQIPFLSPTVMLELGGGGGLEALPGTYRRLGPQGFLARLPLTITRLLGSQLATPAKVALWEPRFRDYRYNFYHTDFSRLSDDELLGRFAELEQIFNKTGTLLLEVSSQFLMTYVLTHMAIQLLLGDEKQGLSRHLFSGLSGLRSAEPGLDLMRMADRIQGSDKLRQLVLDTEPRELIPVLSRDPEGKSLASALDSFLESHGHRAIREAELSVPRWREDPTFPFGVLRSYVATDALPDPQARLEARREAREDATNQVMELLPKALRSVFAKLLKRSQATARTREALRSEVVHTMAFYRLLALEVGRRMEKVGTLSAPEQVFFFNLPELLGWLAGDRPGELLVRAAIRRREFQVNNRIPDPPDWFVLQGGQIVRPGPQETEVRDALKQAGELRGLAGSPGVVLGRACVLTDASNRDRFRPGDVLVVPFADVGWTPLFLIAAGVVTDLGGPLSHSCVVAREYGIPMVVNVKLGGQVIKTGDMLRVDGSSGVVQILEAVEPEEIG